jgi:hypothetical protein
VDREGRRRLLWVVSLALALGVSVFVLARYGVEWSIGAAP